MREYKLKEKAILEGLVKLCLTGDGAEITRKQSDSQCTGGYKPTGEDARNPITGEPMYVDDVTLYGKVQRRFKNMQKCEQIVVASISIKSETYELIQDLFDEFLSSVPHLRLMVSQNAA